MFSVCGGGAGAGHWMSGFPRLGRVVLKPVFYIWCGDIYGPFYLLPTDGYGRPDKNCAHTVGMGTDAVAKSIFHFLFCFGDLFFFFFFFHHYDYFP